MSELDRYSRQTLLPEVGIAGQERLMASSVAVVGCGALGSVIASTLARAIIPHRVPCFRCTLTELPVPDSTPTCDTVGVLSTAASVVASLEVTEGLEILLGKVEGLYGQLIYVDVWTGTFERMDVGKVSGCPVCDLGRYDFLEARQGTYLTSLCGRNAVQVNVRGETAVSFPTLAKRLEPAGEVRYKLL